jgi:hypothetical protein
MGVGFSILLCSSHIELGHNDDLTSTSGSFHGFRFMKYTYTGNASFTQLSEITLQQLKVILFKTLECFTRFLEDKTASPVFVRTGRAKTRKKKQLRARK